MKSIILDRDGVINFDSPDYIKSVNEWHPIPGSIEAIAKASKAGVNVYVATNQSGLARGLFAQADLDAIFAKMKSAVSECGGHFAGIVFCPHGPQDACTCRKPLPGLLFQLAEVFNVNLMDAVFIGDSIRDIQSAKNAMVKPALVKTGNGEQTIEKHKEQLEGIDIFSDLSEAINFYLTEHA